MGKLLNHHSIKKYFYRHWKNHCITRFDKDLERLTNNIYLTFDDGPQAGATDSVLKILARYKVQATFFVIAKKAKEHRSLIAEIKSAGHSIGDHSLDHKYKYFFQGKRALLNWIRQSSETLNEILGEKNIGFRSPAGIRTPELHWALKQLNIPLIHWKRRFFDTALTWSPSRAKASLKRTRPGDIILLHDAQGSGKIDNFLQTLSIYIETALAMGFQFKAIDESVLS